MHYFGAVCSIFVLLDVISCFQQHSQLIYNRNYKDSNRLQQIYSSKYKEKYEFILGRIRIGLVSSGFGIFSFCLGSFLGANSVSHADSTSSTYNVRVSPAESKSLRDDDQRLKEVFKNGLVSGAATRVTKEVLLHPFDTVRVRIQSQGQRSNSSLTSLYLYEDLYNGMVPALLSSVPAGSIFFAVKDYVRSDLRSQGINKLTSTCIAVAIANIPYWVVRCPAETIKTRQQQRMRTSSVKENDESVKRRPDTDWKSGAFWEDLYTSYSSNFFYALPADVLKFLAYEVLTGGRGAGASKSERISEVDAAVFGALSGLFAQAITTPLDVARTRIMLLPVPKHPSGPYDEPPLVPSTSVLTVMKSIAETEGLQGLLKGITPRALRAIASGAIQFASYEFTQNLLN